MKKFYMTYFLLAVITATIAIAQPVISGPNYPPYGTTVTNHQVTATSVSEGSAGASQSWNFSTYPATGLTSTAQYVNPSTTPFASTFPGATIASMSPTSLGNTGYGYMHSTSTYSDLIGVATYSTSSPNIVYTYSDPQRLANYPTVYNSTFTDALAGFATYVNNGFTINQYRYGTVTSKYDGYGMLTTPTGTYTNVIRNKLTQVITDSIVVVGFPSASVTTMHSTTYSWSSATGFSSYYYLSYDTNFANGSTTSNKSAAYSTFVTGIEDFYQSYLPLEVYPNPFTGNSVIHLQADGLDAGVVKLVAADMQGRIAKFIELRRSPADHSGISMDVSDLAPGVYSVRLEQGDRIYVSRFIRQ